MKRCQIAVKVLILSILLWAIKIPVTTLAAPNQPKVQIMKVIREPSPEDRRAAEELCRQGLNILQKEEQQLTAEECQLAVQQFDGALSLVHNYAAAFRGRGIAYRLLGDHDKSLVDLNEALRLDPLLHDTYYHKALTHIAMKQYNDANASLDKVLKSEDSANHVQAYYYRGQVLLLLGKYEQAAQDFSSFLEFENKQEDVVQAYLQRANSYRYVKQFSYALDDLASAQQIRPKVAKIFFQRGLVYKDMGNYDAAIAEFSMALAQDALMVEAHLQRGMIYQERRQYQLALADFIRGVEKGGQGPADNLKQALSSIEGTTAMLADKAYAEGVLALREQQNAKAIAHFTAAIELCPSFHKAYLGRGDAYRYDRQDQKAESDYKTVLTLHWQYEEAHYGLGELLFKQEDWQHSLVQYEKALQINTNYAQAHFGKACVLEKLNRNDQAILAFEAYLKLSDGQPPQMVEEARNRISKLQKTLKPSA